MELEIGLCIHYGFFSSFCCSTIHSLYNFATKDQFSELIKWNYLRRLETNPADLPLDLVSSLSIRQLALRRQHCVKRTPDEHSSLPSTVFMPKRYFDVEPMNPPMTPDTLRQKVINDTSCQASPNSQLTEFHRPNDRINRTRNAPTSPPRDDPTAASKPASSLPAWPARSTRLAPARRFECPRR